MTSPSWRQRDPVSRMSLEVTERNRVLYVHSQEPADCSNMDGLAWELQDIFQMTNERDAQLVCVVLIGATSSFFLRPPTGPGDCDLAVASWPEVTRALLQLSTPTLACVSGDAIGPAWGLALACDLRLVSADARVGNPEIQWGRLPAAGSSQLLTRLVGEARALEMLLLGQILEGQQLPRLGLAIDCPPAAGLGHAAEAVLDRLRCSAPIALGYAREAVRRAIDLPIDEGLRLEADLAALLQTTSDRMTGITGFLNRQPPEFKGR
jgi:enoyl-CoA hydratase/carnithine racemase